MLFAHDTEVALTGAAALVNTVRGDDGDELSDVAALDAFVTRLAAGPATGPATPPSWPPCARCGPRLEQLWESDEDEAADLVNALLRESHALPQLVRHDGWDYHVHAAPPGAPLADADGRRGGAGVHRPDPLQAARPAARCAARRLRQTCTWTCPRTSPGGSAAPRARNRVNVAA